MALIRVSFTPQLIFCCFCLCVEYMYISFQRHIFNFYESIKYYLFCHKSFWNRLGISIINGFLSFFALLFPFLHFQCFLINRNFYFNLIAVFRKKDKIYLTMRLVGLHLLSHKPTSTQCVYRQSLAYMMKIPMTNYRAPNEKLRLF